MKNPSKYFFQMVIFCHLGPKIYGFWKKQYRGYYSSKHRTPHLQTEMGLSFDRLRRMQQQNLKDRFKIGLQVDFFRIFFLSLFYELCL